MHNTYTPTYFFSFADKINIIRTRNFFTFDPVFSACVCVCVAAYDFIVGYITSTEIYSCVL